AAPSARSPPALVPGHPSAPASAFASASTPATAVTKHSKHPYNPGITHPPSACRGPADTTPRQFQPQDFRLLTTPQQQHPSGCLFLHARPGRQRKELDNFRFAFSQVRTRPERQQEAQEALGDPRPFLLPSFA